jgi:thiol-disulfide isomerase/thioredoxin
VGKLISPLIFAGLLIVNLSVTQQAFSSDSVLIEFSSRQCPPCRAMQPVIARLAASGVAVRSVDVDREPELARRYGIRQTPTFLVVSGGKELTRLVGAQTFQQLETALAISPTGPLVQTAATSENQIPQTRLAPLPTALVPPPISQPQNDYLPQDQSFASSAAARSLSEPMPSMQVADAVERAQAATVRLRVYDGTGHGVGTGTVIDTHGEEALVLTCGHLFRDTQGKGRIEVDLFIGGRSETVPGQLVDYDSEDRDIALVAIRPGFPIQPVPVVRAGALPQVGTAAFSFGCDRGDDPSRRDTRVTGVNKFNQHKNASNLEIAGAPIDGRSGGGLFSQDGYLIGVCNAADFKGDIGIYAGPGAIHWQLDRLQLTRLYQGGSDSPVGQDAMVAASGQSNSQFADTPPARLASLDPSAAVEPEWSTSGSTAAQPAMNDASTSDDSEIIVIIRDRKNPEGASRVMTLTRPSNELLQMLQSQAAR